MKKLTFYEIYEQDMFSDYDGHPDPTGMIFKNKIEAEKFIQFMEKRKESSCISYSVKERKKMIAFKSSEEAIIFQLEKDIRKIKKFSSGDKDLLHEKEKQLLYYKSLNNEERQQE